MNTNSVRFISSVLLAILLPLFISCSAKVKRIETDPSFTADKVMDGEFCILGCTSIAVKNPDDMMLSDLLSNEFENTLLEKHGSVRVMPWGDVRRAVGEKKLKQCLKELHDYGSIAPTLLDSLAGSLPQDSRYVVVHRIESDRVKLDKDETGEDRDGTWVVTGHVLKTTRIISATFRVYDLMQRKGVFLATIEGTDETKETVTKDEEVDIGGLLGDVIDAVEAIDEILGEDSDKQGATFPAPPSQDVVMKHIYNKFAEELPKNK